jgi:hypothetical protein
VKITPPLATVVSERHDVRIVATRVPANSVYAERLLLLAMPGRTDELPRVMGWLSVYTDASIVNEIDYIQVDRPFRRSGIGRRLWLEAERVLGRKLDHSPVTTDGEAFAKAMQKKAVRK